MTDCDEAAYFILRAQKQEALAKRAKTSYIESMHRFMAGDYGARATEANNLSKVRMVMK